MTEKESFLNTWQREFKTTMKVLKAYPQGKESFKPHERSKSAHELAWNFVVEEAVMNSALDGKIDFQNIPKPPDKFSDILQSYEKSHDKIFERVKNTPDEHLNKTIQFPVGPNQMGDFKAIDLFWFMLMDKIHHRGQFSVYLRMAGGKVPSIYGPSADEPWM